MGNKNKQLYGSFKRQTSNIALEKIWGWLRSRKVKSKSKFLLIAPENNAINRQYTIDFQVEVLGRQIWDDLLPNKQM